MSRQTETERLKSLDRRIIEIASWLAPATLLNPTMESRRRAWERFRAAYRLGDIIDPTFEYLPLPRADIQRSHKALDALNFGETPVDAIFTSQATQIRLQLRLLEARGTTHFGHIAAQIHGLPNPDLLNLARGILTGDQRIDASPDPVGFHTNGERINAWSMADEMRAALVRMKIQGWKVIVLGEMSARMSVSARHQEVRVKSDSVFTLQDRDRLIVHELGTHVRRACNGFASGLLNLGLGLERYMATEEGLASVMEQKHGLLRRSMTRIYAWRALGAHFAHQGGFADTFRNMLGVGASPEIAWDVTLRVKRGLTNTAHPGGNPKDYVYLHGHQIVTAFLAEGGSEDDLFIGKIAIEHIPLIKDILSRWDFKTTA